MGGRIRLLTAERRHDVGSLCTGMLFALGWLVFLDAAVVGYSWSGVPSPPWYWWFPGFVSSLAFFLLNLVTLRDLSPYSLLMDPEVAVRLRLWLFGALIFSLLPAVASLGAMVAMLVADAHSAWPAVAGVLQTFSIFAASLLFLWARMVGRAEEEAYAQS
jgi:hypothetical protein